MTLRPAVRRPPRIELSVDMLSDGRLATHMASLAVEHGPIFGELPRAGPFAGRRVVYLVGPEANRLVMHSYADRFAHEFGWAPVFGNAIGKGLINMDPPEHPHFRAAMSPAFTSHKLAGYLNVMCRVIADRTRDWAQRGEVDLVVETRKISFDIAAAALLGFEPGADLDLLRERYYALAHGSGQQSERRSEVDDTLLAKIAMCRVLDGRPPNALELLRECGDEFGHQLSHERLLGHVDILLIAGYETTTNLAAWALYMLAAHGEWGAAVDTELAALGSADLTSTALRQMPTLTNVVREAGRLEPPVMFVPRVALSDFDFGGYTVPAGTPVFLAIAAGHRMPSIFTDPDAFDPGRFAPPREEGKGHPYALATFGAGPRTCLGINFAAMEIKAIVAHVRGNYQLTPIPGHQIKRLDGIVQCLPDGIPVRVSMKSKRNHP